MSLKTDGNLSDNYYYESEINDCISIIKKRKEDREGYSAKTVMTLLKIGEPTLWRLVGEGVLERPRIVEQGVSRKKYFFNKMCVDKLVMENTDRGLCNHIKGA